MTVGEVPVKPLLQLYVKPTPVPVTFKVVLGLLQFTVVKAGVIVTIGGLLSKVVVTEPTLLQPFA